MHLLSKSFHMMAIMMRRKIEEKYYLVSKLMITMKVVKMTILMMMRMMGFGSISRMDSPDQQEVGEIGTRRSTKHFIKEVYSMKVKVKRHLFNR